MKDDLIRFDDEDDLTDSEESDNIFEIDGLNEETISSLIDEVYESLDTLENIILSMYYSYNKMETEYTERLNNLEVENEKYREEIKKLYQQLASKSKKKKEDN
jgi:enoyl-[acyl-carrier-protein] reductase (NADH)